MFPATAVPAVDSFKVRVELVMVDGSMSSENPAVKTYERETFSVPVVGLTPRTVGAVESEPLEVRK